jgi:hypothetical protein
MPKNALTLFTGLCAPFRVTRNPDVGRQLVATRRIVAGEILCQEEPLIVGPNQVRTETVFLNCYGAQENGQILALTRAVAGF